MPEKKIKVRLVHSTIGRDRRQEKIVKGLGLRKLYGERILIDTPAVRGMVAKIPHLVTIVEEEAKAGVRPKVRTKARKEAKNEAE